MILSRKTVRRHKQAAVAGRVVWQNTRTLRSASGALIATRLSLQSTVRRGLLSPWDRPCDEGPAPPALWGNPADRQTAVPTGKRADTCSEWAVEACSTKEMRPTRDPQSAALGSQRESDISHGTTYKSRGSCWNVSTFQPEFTGTLYSLYLPFGLRCGYGRLTLAPRCRTIRPATCPRVGSFT